MNLFVRTTAAILATCLSLAAAPALAVPATDYIAPKLVHRANSSVPIAGAGTVVVQVLVHPNGSFQVIKVIRSTNPGNNATALDIARRSTYSVGLRGGKPTIAFYDFTLRFAAGRVNTGLSAISRLMDAKNYNAAAAAAQRYLAGKPNDQMARAYLAISQASTNDFANAAMNFDKVTTIPKAYVKYASQIYSLAAGSVAKQDPQLAVSYAQKSLKLFPSNNGYFALGIAQLANKDAVNALPNLQKAHDAMATDHVTDKQKISIDTALLQAYAALNDQANMNAMAAEIKQVDPTSLNAARVLAQSAVSKAQTLQTAKKYPEAAAQYVSAAETDPEMAPVAYAQAVFALSFVDKPDTKTMNAYADKAVAANANDPYANFAKGTALLNLAAEKNNDPALKKQGRDFLNKADGEAKDAKNTALSTSIENLIKTIR